MPTMECELVIKRSDRADAERYVVGFKGDEAFLDEGEAAIKARWTYELAAEAPK